MSLSRQVFKRTVCMLPPITFFACKKLLNNARIAEKHSYKYASLRECIGFLDAL